MPGPEMALGAVGGQCHSRAMELVAIVMQLIGLCLIGWRERAYRYGGAPRALRWASVALILGGIALQIWIRHGLSSG